MLTLVSIKMFSFAVIVWATVLASLAGNRELRLPYSCGHALQSFKLCLLCDSDVKSFHTLDEKAVS